MTYPHLNLWDPHRSAHRLIPSSPRALSAKTFDIDPLPSDFAEVLSYFTWVEFDLSEITYPTGCLSGKYLVI